MTIKKSAAKALGFLSKNSKLIILGAAILAVLAAVAAGGLWWYGSTNQTIATVNGEKITKSDYAKEYDIFGKKASFMEDSSTVSSENVKAYLVERKILDIAAKDYSVSVSDEEVNSDIDSSKEAFNGDLEQLKKSYEDAYGLDSEELTKTVYYKLLKEKVSEKVVQIKTGKFIYARFNTGNNVEEITGVTTDQLDSWAKGKVDSWKLQLDAGKTFSDLYESVLAEGKYPAYSSSDFTHDSLDDSPGAQQAAIAGLSVDRYSDVIRVDGFYAIYYLEKQSSGKYADWDAFIQDYTNKYVKYSFSLGSVSSTISGAITSLKELALNIVGVNSAYATCAICATGGCNGYGIHGYVTDKVTGTAITGATVLGTSDSSAFCDGSTSSAKIGYCGNRSGSDGTNSKGYYNISRIDGTSCRFNCAGGTVALKISKLNYTTLNSSIDGSNGNSYSRSFKLVPANRTLKVAISPAGAGNVQGTQINCGTDCTATWAFSSASTKIAATPAAGYDFSHWEAYSGNTTFSGAHNDYTIKSLTIGHGQNQSMRAVFTHTPTTDCTNGSCPPKTDEKYNGCTDKTATNYNSVATVDDGSCIFRQDTTSPSLSCTVTPATGESPLVVKVHTVTSGGAVGPFQYKMDSGKTDELLQNDKPGDFWYTYSKPGSYAIDVNLQSGPLAEWTTCYAASTSRSQIVVTDPSNTSGGEVSQ